MRRIGILRGGIGDEYESSLREGADIIAHIHQNLSDKYKPVDILIDKDGVWHAQGVPVEPAGLMHEVDIVWNTSHPTFSKILGTLSLPIVGVSHFASSLVKSRTMLEEHLKNIGVNMPASVVLPLYQEDFDLPPPRLRQGEADPKVEYAIRKAKEIHERFGAPWIVKSFTPDSDMAIHVAKTFPELVEAIYDGLTHQVSILVEELITGKNTSLHSIPNFRGEDIYIFPCLAEAGVKAGRLAIRESEKLVNLAKDLHTHLGASHYLKSDFVLHPNRGIYLTSVSFSPDLKPNSLFHLACASVGAKMHHVVEHILEQAL